MSRDTAYRVELRQKIGPTVHVGTFAAADSRKAIEKAARSSAKSLRRLALDGYTLCTDDLCVPLQALSKQIGK